MRTAQCLLAWLQVSQGRWMTPQPTPVALFATAADNLRLGLPVVLDAPFAALLGDPDFLTTSAGRASWPPEQPVVVVEVRASPRRFRSG